MKIFVTGGTGFIGSSFLKTQAASHHDITCVVRESSIIPETLASELRWMKKGLDEVTVADLDGHDVLVHLASVGVSPQVASWTDMMYWNVAVFARLLDTAYDAGIRRIVVAGTFAEYGTTADAYDYIPVDAALSPVNGYAASKAASAIIAKAFCIEKKIELAYLRIFSAFGEGQNPANFYPSLREAAHSGKDFSMTLGEQVRDYIPVNDVSKVIWQSVLSDDFERGCPKVRNVASGVPTTMRSFAEKWWGHFGATGKLLLGEYPYRDNEPMRFVPKLDE